VIVVSVFALASLVLDLNTAEFMISFGALAAFAMVNLSAIKDEFLRKDRLTVWLWTSLEPST
jgi:putrescine importer